VAVTGLIFFGALTDGYAYAFGLSLVQLASLPLVVVLLTRLAPVAARRQAVPISQPVPMVDAGVSIPEHGWVD
jgi:hypothetical protein